MSQQASKLVHLALGMNSKQVVAHFLIWEDAAKFCEQHKLCHMPFNLNNKDRKPAPLVGTVYEA